MGGLIAVATTLHCARPGPRAACTAGERCCRALPSPNPRAARRCGGSASAPGAGTGAVAALRRAGPGARPAARLHVKGQITPEGTRARACSAATTTSAISTATSSCASAVLAPRCGVHTTSGRRASGWSSGGGSCARRALGGAAGCAPGAAAPAACRPPAHEPASSGGCIASFSGADALVAGVQRPARRVAARCLRRSGVGGAREVRPSASHGAQPGRAYIWSGHTRRTPSVKARRAAVARTARPRAAPHEAGRTGQGRGGCAARAGAPTCMKTSSAACATTPASSARASAASSITPPRATFTTRAPRFILANAASPKMPCAPARAADAHAPRSPAPPPGLASACSAAPNAQGAWACCSRCRVRVRV